jgi:hypothetical protein
VSDKSVIGRNKDVESAQQSEEGVTADDQQDGIPLWAVELGCWTMVALAPFLYWVNGPAVSTDQFVVRTAVVTLALVGGVAIRVYRWRQGKKAATTPEDASAQVPCDSAGTEK